MENLKKKILVIEDDEFLAELLIKKLQESGKEILLAKNATIGLNLLQSEKVNLILLDLILPGMNGFEFLKIIKDDKNIANIPVVILSNLSQEEEIRRAKILGAKDFLVKAFFTPKEIVEKIEKFLI